LVFLHQLGDAADGVASLIDELADGFDLALHRRAVKRLFELRGLESVKYGLGGGCVHLAPPAASKARARCMASL